MQGKRYTMLNLAMLLEDCTREVPKRASVLIEDTELSYAELKWALDMGDLYETIID